MKEGYNSRRKGGSDHGTGGEHKFSCKVVNVLGQRSLPSQLGEGKGPPTHLSGEIKRKDASTRQSRARLGTKACLSNSGSWKVDMCNVDFATGYSMGDGTERTPLPEWPRSLLL